MTATEVRYTLNREAARRFLDCLFEPYGAEADATVDFRSLNGTPARQQFFSVEIGQIEGWWYSLEWAAREVAQGRDVYVGVNPRSGTGDGTKAALWPLSHWVFAEVDDADTSYALDQSILFGKVPQPTICVASGGVGHMHYYWRLPAPMSLEGDGLRDYERVLRAVAKGVGGDMKATDATRILRLPGSYNFKRMRDGTWKYGEPQEVRIAYMGGVK